MKEDNTPSYYSILPAIVRYHKELTPLAKLIFSELTALANKTGKAYPNNKTLANWYGVSKKTISTSISLLEEKKLIIVEIEKNKKGTFRSIIPLVDPISLGRGGKKCNTPITKTSNPMEENVKPKEYTYNNTTSNNKYIEELKQILLLFQELTGVGFKIPSPSKVKNYGAYKLASAIFNKGYSLEDILSVIKFKYQNWKDQKKMLQYINYNTILRSSNFEKYYQELQITNNLKTNTNESRNNNSKTLQNKLESILQKCSEEGYL